MRWIFFLTVCLFLPTNASAFCDRMPVTVSVRTKVPAPAYHHNRRWFEFPNLPPADQQPAGMQIRGLTVSRIEVSGKAVSGVQRFNDHVCLGLKEVVFEISLPQLDIYIDRKYPASSCEYQVTKRHEEIHAGIFKQAVDFFRPDIEKELRAATNRRTPRLLYPFEATPEKIESLTQQEFQAVMDDVAPLIRHVNAKIAQKNAQIDTPESYKQTSDLCKNW